MSIQLCVFKSDNGSLICTNCHRCKTHNWMEDTTGSFCIVCGVCKKQITSTLCTYQPPKTNISNGPTVYLTGIDNDKLQRIQNKMSSNRENAFRNLISDFMEKCETKSISKRIVDDAVNRFKVVNYSNKSCSSHKGKKKDALLGVCLYMAFRACQHDTPQHFIQDLLGIRKNYFTKATKRYYQVMYQEYVIDPCNETRLVDFFCGHLKCPRLSIPVQKIKKVVEELTMFQMSPNSIIAGIIYFLGQELGLDIPISYISANCFVSESTIEKVFKPLVQNRKLIFQQVRFGRTLKFVDKTLLDK